MQQFDHNGQDHLSSAEAREVLRAWNDRQQVTGVDPSVGSISALAAAMGVSEAEVRRQVEDLRIQNRSHEIAAGIIQQENARRKRLDSTAALTAAIAFVIVGLVAAFVFVYWRSTAVGRPSPVIVHEIPEPPAFGGVTIDVDPEGTPTDLEMERLTRGIAAVALETALTELEAQRTALEAERSGAKAAQAKELEQKIAELRAKTDELRTRIREQRSIPTPPPTPSGR